MAENKLVITVIFSMIFVGFGCIPVLLSPTGEQVRRVASQRDTDCIVDDYEEIQGLCHAVDYTQCNETPGLCSISLPNCGNLPNVTASGICGTTFTRSHGKSGASRFCKECDYHCTSCYQLNVVARDVRDPTVSSVFPLSCTDNSCIQSLRTEFVRLFNTSITFPCFSTGASLQLTEYSLSADDIVRLSLTSFLWSLALLLVICYLKRTNFFNRVWVCFKRENHLSIPLRQAETIL